MSSFILKIKDTSGNEGTIIPDAGFSYTDNLNDINEGQIKITGTGEVKRSLFSTGSEVYIYRNNSLEFHGFINGLSFLDGGGIAADISGYEIWLAKENGDYSSSPWSNTASSTIASSIIGESTKFSAGVIEAGENLDFRAEPTSSLWNALSSLISRTAQDISIDYANTEVDILDHKGNSTSVMTLNDGLQIQNLVVRQSYPIGNDVRVYGKGEGNSRIKSDHTSYGQDATSKATYGTIRKIYNDPSVTTQAEANTLADKLVAKWKNPVKIYEFDVINPNKSLVAGDVITLNSTTKGLNNEEVRIVSIEKGSRNGQEFLTLQVTNKEFKSREKDVNKLLAKLSIQANDQQTYDQYLDEYANQYDSTCWAGFAFAGEDICGCTGKWIYLTNANISVPSGVVQMQTLNVNISSAYSTIFDELSLCGCKIIQLADPTNNQDAATKNYVDTCVAAGGSSMWADGTNPYIIPCNSCSICVPGIAMTGNICDALGTGSLGINSSPGAFATAYIACVFATTCTATPTIYQAGGVSICNSTGKVADFGTACTCLATIRTKDIHAFANGSCCVGISACRFLGGYINNLYACRRMVLPVGVNCY